MSLRTIKSRRRENKTDYKLRLGLLKSSLDRIVIRKTNRYIILQVVKSASAQDKVSFGITSKALLDYGWNKKFNGSLKSIPASYLTGYLAAKNIGKGEFIIDTGMAISQKGGRIFAVVNGLVDGGLKIKANPSVFPKKEKIMGENVKKDIKESLVKIKTEIDSKAEKTKVERKEKNNEKTRTK